MEKQEKYDMERLVDLAASGNRDALEELLGDVQDMVFNLSLRMLGTVPDAEDACQEILIKVMTHLSDFRKESRFSTWVFRICCKSCACVQEAYVQPTSSEFRVLRGGHS